LFGRSSGERNPVVIRAAWLISDVRQKLYSMSKSVWAKRLSISLTLLAVLLTVRYFRLHDEFGDEPQDVVRMFVEAAKKGDYARAAKAWRNSDVRVIEKNYSQSFEQFCIDRFQVDHYIIRSEGVDKGYRWYYYTGFKGKDEKVHRFFVREVDGRWCLVMESLMRE
jgi:hypothetical protein